MARYPSFEIFRTQSTPKISQADAVASCRYPIDAPPNAYTYHPTLRCHRDPPILLWAFRTIRCGGDGPPTPTPNQVPGADVTTSAMPLKLCLGRATDVVHCYGPLDGLLHTLGQYGKRRSLLGTTQIGYNTRSSVQHVFASGSPDVEHIWEHQSAQRRAARSTTQIDRPPAAHPHRPTMTPYDAPSLTHRHDTVLQVSALL
ncbi:hypothetical protein C8R44DRAFT_866129 [Mycena epipterygia]|nr:hypothetical protein C8R44DRAFT_866129 [Mycena epipterygia]